jgi:hypothetical protein
MMDDTDTISESRTAARDDDAMADSGSITDGVGKSVWLQRMRPVATIAIAGVIVYQLTTVGWGEVLSALPTAPLFYILLFLNFLLQPTTELVIYRGLWKGISVSDSFRAFLTKRVYNDELLGYSGEVFLYAWGRQASGQSGREVLRDVRDVNILSALSSTVIAALLVGGLLVMGLVALPFNLHEVQQSHIIIGILVLAAGGFAATRLRRHVFALPPGAALRVLGLHSGRFLLFHSLIVLQWIVVLPGVSMGVWLTLITTMIVVNRIPFLPSRDLVFLGAGIELSRHLDVVTAEVAAIFVVATVLTKLLNLAVYVTPLRAGVVLEK